MVKMGKDFNCGCRVSGGWYLCHKHEDILIALLIEFDPDHINTISDIVQDKKGKTIKYVNERPMKDAK